ncbi:acyl-CoA thioesterase [Sphingomonas colocasiae]|uniref:Acyl-CoA thioesterase n=1 Tax=Sphingomonas colocasiae TaxID=1848973 RepID=A0ABS7PL23_9SPHN|nr:thioesterase family protein [Sphingomonas colocasiae]MBY8821430.1 acyl-CoA thioesterase [Sphingomonas colocasiae]
MFRATYPLRFAHCDPAGIAYYPRYFELCDAAIEDWTAEVIGISRREMHLDLGLGMPTVDLKASFAAPSRLGDLLDIAVAVERVGRSSVALALDISCAGEARFAVNYVQVLTSLTESRSVPWPDHLLQRLRNAAKKENP